MNQPLRVLDSALIPHGEPRIVGTDRHVTWDPRTFIVYRLPLTNRLYGPRDYEALAEVSEP